ncbi:MAG: class I SAM-dependent methyltransferase [Chthoniobacterales bacterium]|nr:class I SAM-dependent methyltransferase [Chthoniobacterales bacterium]
MTTSSPEDLRRIYGKRFAENVAYRQRVWRVLVPSFFQRYIRAGDVVLDLGCGYGEFINTVVCRQKLAMDLNPDAPSYLDADVQFLPQDCSAPWSLSDGSLHVVFTSNFFEHLPDKAALGRTLDQAFRCLAPGGQLIAMGPNVKYLPGSYWDFWDHHLALTESSMSEGLRHHGFDIAECHGRFLPYRMVGGPEYPDVLVQLYLKLPIAWQFLGKQFLVIATKPPA